VTLLFIWISGTAFADDELAELESRMAPFRKLQQGGGPPPACLSACPELSNSMAAMQSMASQSPSGTSNGGMPSLTDMTRMTQKSYEDMYGVMCQQKSAFQCMAANAAVCQDPGSSQTSQGGLSGSGPPDMVQMSAELDCMCDTCPSMPGAMGNLMGAVSHMLISALSQAFSGFSGQSGPTTTISPQAQQTQMLQMLCPLVDSFKCVANSGGSVCDTTKTQVASMNLTDISNVVAMESTCAQSGYATSLPEHTEASGALMVSATLRLSAIVSLVGSFFAAFTRTD